MSNPTPWWHRPLRIYQANNFEVDPKEISGEQIARQCEDLHCNTIIVDAGGGISTFYHSDIEYLTPNPFLRPDQDFFRAMMEACRSRNIRVFARNDYGNMSLETAKKHPDWPLRLRNGEVAQVYDVVYSRRTADHYGRENPEERVMEPFYAACRALLEEHVPFVVISDEQLTAQRTEDRRRMTEAGSLKSEIRDLKFDTLILPNVACLSDEAAAFVDEFAKNGGAVIADHETGLYDEIGAVRDDYAMRCFGISLKERIEAPAEEWKHSRLHAYLEITATEHPLFDGFEHTGILPQKGPWMEVDHDDDVNVVCRHIRKSDAQPPEKGWRGEKGTTPMVLCRGKAVYFAVPIFSLLGRYRLPDHRRLLGNAVRMTTDLPIEVDAPCSIEVTLLRLSDGRRAVGLVNHTAGLLRDHTPVPTGPVRIRFRDGDARKAEALNGHEVSVKNGEIVLPILQTYDLITVDAR